MDNPLHLGAVSGEMNCYSPKVWKAGSWEVMNAELDSQIPLSLAPGLRTWAAHLVQMLPLLRPSSQECLCDWKQMETLRTQRVDLLIPPQLLFLPHSPNATTEAWGDYYLSPQYLVSQKENQVCLMQAGYPMSSGSLLPSASCGQKLRNARKSKTRRKSANKGFRKGDRFKKVGEPAESLKQVTRHRLAAGFTAHMTGCLDQGWWLMSVTSP